MNSHSCVIRPERVTFHAAVAAITLLHWSSPAPAQYDACTNGTGYCWEEQQTFCVGGTENGKPCDLDDPFFLSDCLKGGGVCLGVPGCGEAWCCEAVCALDPFCCNTSWDEVCAQDATSACGAPPTRNDECYSPALGEGARPLPLFERTFAFTTTATRAATDPVLCCEEDRATQPLTKTVWFWFTAPPPSTGNVVSSVRLTTCLGSGDPPWPRDTLLQVFAVTEPDVGLCNDRTTGCRVSAQDCPSGIGPCALDEARSCQDLTPIACNDDAPPSSCLVPDAAALCVGQLLPGNRYYVLLAVPDELGTDVYEILAYSPCADPAPLADCNGNGVLDECDVRGGAPDQNRNRVPDECELLGECTRDNVVDLNDGKRLIGCITGPFGGEFTGWLPYECRCVDLNGDRDVDLLDVSDFFRRFGAVR